MPRAAPRRARRFRSKPHAQSSCVSPTLPQGATRRVRGRCRACISCCRSTSPKGTGFLASIAAISASIRCATCSAVPAPLSKLAGNQTITGSRTAATCRTTSGGGSPAASWPWMALAMTRPRECARPSPSRWHQCATGSAWPNTGLTQTSPSRTSAGQVGTSSAHRSKVQPLARSKRAWCQWRAGAVLDAAAIQRKAHMRAAVVEREDTILVVDDEYRSMRPVHDQPPLRLQLLKARDCSRSCSRSR